MSAAPGLHHPARVGLSALCLAHSAWFAWAALALPGRFWTPLALPLALLCVLHLATAACALARNPLLLVWSWRLLSLCSLLVFLGLGGSIAAAALYVSRLYSGLGTTLASALWAAGLLLALTTLPIAIWGAFRTLPPRALSLGRSAAAAGAITFLCVLSLPILSRAAVADAAPNVDSALVAELGELLEDYARRPGARQGLSVAGAGPARCEKPIGGPEATLLLTYVTRTGAVKVRCLQPSSTNRLKRELRRLLRRQARPGSSLVVDLITASKPLSDTLPFLDTLKLRPGMDGVCADQLCLPAWQLVLQDSFGAHRLLQATPDIRYGFSPTQVRKALGAAETPNPDSVAGLIRIESESFSVDGTGAHRLTRTRPFPPALSKHGVDRAVADARELIVAAQQPDGTFRHSLDPVTGSPNNAPLDLEQQAAATYALCEQAEGRHPSRGVAKALAVFSAHERLLGNVSALSLDDRFSLGTSAFPLLAMLSCRRLPDAGRDNDRLIGQLSRLILLLQRESGGFFPAFDASLRRGAEGPDTPHAAGLALLALVLVEQALPQLERSGAEPLPTAGAVRAAIDRAMTFYSGPYWPAPLREVFFFDEGWHCQAAQKALASHRNESYENLCLDYVAARSSWVLRGKDTPEPSLVGGWSVSRLFPPQHGVTATFSQALGAAVAIKLARGMKVEADLLLLREVTAFLLRAQWRRPDCYACKTPERAVGGFSQHLASPHIRTHYVHEAMTALAKAAHLLKLR